MTNEKNIFVYKNWKFSPPLKIEIQSSSPPIFKKIVGRLNPPSRKVRGGGGGCTLWDKFINMGGIIYEGQERDPVGNYAYCLRNRSILQDPIRENPLLSCLYFVIEHKSINPLDRIFQKSLPSRKGAERNYAMVHHVCL